MDLDREMKSRAATSDASLPTQKHSLRNFLIAGAGFVLCVILAFVFRAQILTGMADYLIVKDDLQPADVIFLLNSEYDIRPFRAAELYQQGLAPVIAIARSEDSQVVEMGLVPNDTDISVGVMEKLGVPPESIIVVTVPGGVTSTFDEAVAFRQYAEAAQVHKFILVTSSFHTRRASWIFRKTLAGLPIEMEMAAVPYKDFDQTTWWKNETGLIILNNEYIKLLFYLFKYH
jgi:uncharacterized SAM-binding protein YcdF (DUF218 family)